MQEGDVTDFIMAPRERAISHTPTDPPLCENVSFDYRHSLD